MIIIDKLKQEPVIIPKNITNPRKLVEISLFDNRICVGSKTCEDAGNYNDFFIFNDLNFYEYPDGEYEYKLDSEGKETGLIRIGKLNKENKKYNDTLNDNKTIYFED